MWSEILQDDEGKYTFVDLVSVMAFNLLAC